MFSGITTKTEMRPTKIYICSDGSEYLSLRKAMVMESRIKLREIFNEAILTKGYVRSCKNKYPLDSGDHLEIGVYPITIRNRDDLFALENAFPCITERLGYPDKFPFDTNIEIYKEDIPNLIAPSCCWRIYKKII